MNAGASALVLASAATHAYWNYLLKRSGASHAIVGLSKVAEAILWIPFLALSLHSDRAAIADSWGWPVVGAGLVLLAYGLLTRAYATGEFSVVYPISRGSILLFLPPLAFLTLGERLGPLELASVAVILIGIVAAHWTKPQRSAGDTARPILSSAGVATLAGLVASAYTIWDKRAVQSLAPALYFASYTALVAVAYGAILLRSTALADLRRQGREHWRVIGQVAIFNSVSYLLALFALRIGNATYVIALRQSSIVIGAALGVWLLHERLSPTRAAGIGLILSGCLLFAWVH
jgi:drug/metabolite transporter (DMT)-like permease